MTEDNHVTRLSKEKALQMLREGKLKPVKPTQYTNPPKQDYPLEPEQEPQLAAHPTEQPQNFIPTVPLVHFTRSQPQQTVTDTLGKRIKNIEKFFKANR